MDETPDLAPCPFCGSAPRLCERYSCCSDTRAAWVECHCGGRGPLAHRHDVEPDADPDEAIPEEVAEAMRAMARERWDARRDGPRDEERWS